MDALLRRHHISLKRKRKQCDFKEKLRSLQELVLGWDLRWLRYLLRKGQVS